MGDRGAVWQRTAYDEFIHHGGSLDEYANVQR